MTLPIFQVPLGVEGGSSFFKWAPRFSNQSQKTLSGASIDVSLSPYPIHDFELIISWMRDPGTTPGASSFTGSEWRAIQAFYMSMNGSQGRFLFLNPDDDNVTNQLITADGSTTDTWTIVRTFGDPSAALTTEPVGQVKLFPAPNVYFGGVLKTLGTDYDLDLATPGAQTVDLLVSVAPGTPITMDFTFYYYCHFAEDSSVFEKWMNQHWLNGSVKFQSCLAGA